MWESKLPCSESELRVPSVSEAQGIVRWLEGYYASRIKVCKTGSTILGSVGFVFLVLTSTGGLLGIVLGLLAYAGVFVLIYDKKTIQERLNAFQTGKYRVVDGHVERWCSHPDRAGVCDVRFRSMAGVSSGRWFFVRREGVENGSPLLLAVTMHGVLRKQIAWVFTSFMLSEEGSGRRW